MGNVAAELRLGKRLIRPRSGPENSLAARAEFGKKAAPSSRGGTVFAKHIGVWRSLVARFVRDEEAVGSNPATPTILRFRVRESYGWQAIGKAG